MIKLLASHSRRLVALSGLTAIALLCVPGGHFVAAASPPNILIFLADDSGWGDYSASGNTNIRTPNIDAIGRAGAVLDRFYVCPVCSPTRAEFLTGRYHPRGGVRRVSSGQEPLNLDEKTIADAFKAAGYATGAFGKWHNGSQWPYHPNVSARSLDYRFDHQGALFRMFSDPGQTNNIASEESAIATLFANKVADRRKDELGQTAAPDSNLKGKAKAPGLLPDDRPYPVGYAEFPMTPLPARDGVPHGGVKRSASAPNSSYFVNWNSPADSMTWDIAVHTTGNYDVMFHYTAAEPGATIELSFNGSKLADKVTPAWNPPLYTNQDTIPRPAAESQMKEFRPLKLGTLRLEKGRGQLTLRALDIPGQSVMDVRALYLTLQK